MESTTNQLSTYPHLIPADAIPGTVYRHTSLHRRHPEIRDTSDHDVHLHRRSRSSVNLNHQDTTARHVDNNAAVKHSRMVSEFITSEDEPDVKRGEFRYDFRFGGNFEDDQNPSFKPLRTGRDQNSAFTVASARTLCSLSPSPSPPTSLSSHPPSNSEETPKTEYVTSSPSTITSMLLEKHHGLYCRLKTFLVSFLRLNSNATAINICSHNFRHGRCKKCNLPEVILPYMGSLRTGSHCKEHRCEGCCDCTSTLVHDTYGSEEDLRVAPLRVRSRVLVSPLYTGTLAGKTESASSISSEAPQIGPIDFIPTTQSTYNASNCTSGSSIVSNHLSSDTLFDSSPTHFAAPELFSSPTEYSLSPPPYLPAHHVNTSTPCRRRLVDPSRKQDEPSSPESTESNEVLEVNVPATAVPMMQVSPTTIRIPHSRTASHPPATLREMQNLHDIAHGAVHGDIECQTLKLKRYQNISSAHPLPDSSYMSESDCLSV